MEIELIRQSSTRWGVDGTLNLAGRPWCDTVEHPERLLPPGTYPLRLAHSHRYGRTMPTLRRATVLCPANGPFALRFGSIAVGRHHLSGVLTGCADCFDQLMRRIQACQARGEPVTLTVR